MCFLRIQYTVNVSAIYGVCNEYVNVWFTHCFLRRLHEDGENVRGPRCISSCGPKTCGGGKGTMKRNSHLTQRGGLVWNHLRIGD